MKKDIKKEDLKQQKKESLFSGVKREMGKVRWPLKNEMVKASIAVLSLIVFFAVFFYLLSFIIGVIKVWV